MSYTQSDIEHLSGARGNSCACAVCKDMCKHTPCLGTPQDILKIAQAGYEAKLSLTAWGAGLPYGMPIIYMVQPNFDETKKQCAFLTDDGLCELHDKELKPTEGRLADCTTKKVPEGKIPLPFVIAKTWIVEESAKEVEAIIQALNPF